MTILEQETLTLSLLTILFLAHPFPWADRILSRDTQEFAQEPRFQFKIALKK